ncbi:helix-turn-helix domain-containing protein [Clostridium oryzae]|uniref:HTH-type transcriptional regulator YesS n=1 Tax=Clostridium oryzae TaxID=1450648 RepID=A0A1V4IB02_9CLOT|nr:helix-turn-helix domain-containing protein [Clostridium oryzae]OPJ56707.1 HTH-type transcriptional regulator YesS [Clostridium oryzae]
MFNRLRGRNKIYMRMLITLVSVIEATILLISVILFYNLKKNMTRQLYEIYVQDIKKSINDVQAIINIMHSTSVQMKYDYYVKLLSSYREPDATQYLPVLQQIDNYRMAVNVIDSIYIYNSGKFYISDDSATNFIQSEKVIKDKSILPIVKNYSQYRILKPIPRMISNLKTRKQSEGTSFILYEKVPISSKSIVIINLKNDWLKGITQQMEQVGSIENIVVDNKGKIIIDSHDNKMFKVSNKEYVKNVINSSKNSGYFVSDVNNNKCLITYNKMKSIGWSFVSVIPYKVVNKSISGVLMNVLIICGVILLMGMAAAVFLSRKFYNPFENLLNQLSLYEREKTDILDEHRKKFLTNFIFHSNELQENLINKGMEEYNINFSSSQPYILVLIQIEKNDEFNGAETDISLIKFAIYNIAKEIIQEQCAVETIDISEKDVLFILNRENGFEAISERITKEIRNIQKLINNYFQVSVSATLSGEITEYRKLNKAYEELKESSKNKFFYGFGALISNASSVERSKNKYSYSDQKVKDIIVALTSGKGEKAKQIYMNIVDELSKCSYNVYQINLTLLFWEISENIKGIKISKNESWIEKLQAFAGEISNMSNIDTVNDIVSTIFDGISQSCRKTNSSKYEDMANQIRNIIDKKYDDINLSVEAVSDMIGFTSSYITKIFKQYTGKTIIEYINQKRIDVAKEMLEKTAYNVGDISEKCGFANITYFHRAFKKSVGITPSLYREKRRGNNELKLDLKI